MTLVHNNSRSSLRESLFLYNLHYIATITQKKNKYLFLIILQNYINTFYLYNLSLIILRIIIYYNEYIKHYLKLKLYNDYLFYKIKIKIIIFI